jgi:RNA polymerase sigma-70 factor (sigma-E family)
VEDDPGFEAFVAGAYRALVATGRLLVGPDLAEDLVQASLIRTFVRWRSLRDPKNATAYTRTVMARLAVRWGRRRWRGEEAGRVLDPIPFEDHSDRVAAADDVLRALRGLPVAHRAVLVLRFYEQLSEADVARALRCRPGTVKSRTARAIAQLRSGGLLDNPATLEEKEPPRVC